MSETQADHHRLSEEASTRPSTKELKRVLGFWDLMGASAGQIIGAGIMTLTGVAIAMTGRSVPISFLLAALLVVVLSVPFVLINGSVRLRGGMYTIITELVHPSLGGFFTLIFIMTNISISLYAMSFAQYLQALVPVNVTVVGVAVLVVFYVLNLVGVNAMAKVENFVVSVLVIALATFSVFGIGKIVPDYFAEASWMPNGWMGLLQAAALLTFATGGATVVANLAGEAKNPVKDIPKVIIFSTLGVAVLYAFMSVIAAGVLPIDDVAGQPLTLVAQEILPAPLYYFFVVGGAMFALVSTLNAQLAWATKPVLQACVDGWFPRWLGYIHPKTGTPVVLLTLLFLVGLVPILVGLNLGEIGTMVIFISQAVNILYAVAILNLQKKMPEQWNASSYHISRPWLWVVVLLSAFVTVLQAYLMAAGMSPTMVWFNVGFAVVGLAYSLWWYRSGRTDMEVSYESD
ncbi:MAG: APC family permease [Propioniciclava sp.]